jgi:hypothetical protein
MTPAVAASSVDDILELRLRMDTVEKLTGS